MPEPGRGGGVGKEAKGVMAWTRDHTTGSSPSYFLVYPISSLPSFFFDLCVSSGGPTHASSDQPHSHVEKRDWCTPLWTAACGQRSDRNALPGGAYPSAFHHRSAEEAWEGIKGGEGKEREGKGREGNVGRGSMTRNKRRGREGERRKGKGREGQRSKVHHHLLISLGPA